MEGYTAFGFVEILGKIPAHVRLLRTLEAEFRAGRYDLLIVTDYPGFHLRLAEAARRHGVKVLYYIAPQLWAWRPGRARRLLGAVDRLAVVLPFEAEFFAGHGIDAEYVGTRCSTVRRSRAVPSRGRRWASGATRGCSGSFPAAAPRRSNGSGRRSARRPAVFSRVAGAMRSWSPARRRRTILKATGC